MSIGVGTVAFSGSREIPDGALDVVRAVAARTYVSGACIGLDQAAASLVAEHWPNRAQRIIVPRNRTRVDEVWLSTFRARHHTTVRVNSMPRGTTYRDRNLALLGSFFEGVPALRPDLLIAFPLHAAHDSRSVRSGTWMTVRLARSLGIRTQVYLLGADPDQRHRDRREIEVA
jgi:hypothetical protein